MKVTVLKPFAHGRLNVNPGDEIEIDAHRHVDLARNGLVSAPEDMAPQSATKAEFGVIKTSGIAVKDGLSRSRKITGA